MKFKTLLIFLFCFMLTLCGCDVNKPSSNRNDVSKNEKQNFEYSDANKPTSSENDVSKNEEENFEYSYAANLVMTEFLNYYGIYWSEIEEVGEEELSGQIYYTYKYTDPEFNDYTLFVLINGNDKSIYGGYPNSGLDFLWFNGKPVEDEEYDSTPYINYDLNIIGDSFESYKNRVGGYFSDITENTSITIPDIKRHTGISYYRTSDTFVAVDNGTVVVVVVLLNDYAASTPVRDVINDLQMTEMFEIAPEIKNVQDNVDFLFTWRANNGYVGIRNLGKSDPQWYYNNYSRSIIFCNDKMHLSAYAEE